MILKYIPIVNEKKLELKKEIILLQKSIANLNSLVGKLTDNQSKDLVYTAPFESKIFEKFIRINSLINLLFLEVKNSKYIRWDFDVSIAVESNCVNSYFVAKMRALLHNDLQFISLFFFEVKEMGVARSFKDEFGKNRLLRDYKLRVVMVGNPAIRKCDFIKIIERMFISIESIVDIKEIETKKIKISKRNFYFFFPKNNHFDLVREIVTYFDVNDFSKVCEVSLSDYPLNKSIFYKQKDIHIQYWYLYMIFKKFKIYLNKIYKDEGYYLSYTGVDTDFFFCDNLSLVSFVKKKLFFEDWDYPLWKFRKEKTFVAKLPNVVAFNREIIRVEDCYYNIKSGDFFFEKQVTDYYLPIKKEILLKTIWVDKKGKWFDKKSQENGSLICGEFPFLEVVIYNCNEGILQISGDKITLKVIKEISDYNGIKFISENNDLLSHYNIIMVHLLTGLIAIKEIYFEIIKRTLGKNDS